ncbi:bifunctional 2-polyprenyl-6-hydroxyphenol methylase/3-demethylubiquinol 3-O-methyltransferase UbiG [uncultured Methanobrevibacter sp.]|uniref:class I SAM-dependent methyltransferase n=1 Tax=uncultured Methanobrevibacter sp. TaxID=253161 RepID=UPI0025DE0CAD|nr:class I SAM-dependent methyltransferase [uncultured Methanobrevibacter sp.]
MAVVNKKFYNNETEYSDGSVEDEILDIVKNNDDYEDIINEDLRWPVFYHLSHLRENLFNWYPFRKDANLLEIGAGCGALTGLFCSRVSDVTAVELTERRSKIIYNRHKDLENLELFPGNLNNMEFNKKFDYIILCGVLEYAYRFTKSDNPYVDFIKKIKSMLSEDGVILVAIENRIGLKYLSGSKEDHLGRWFVGINDYPDVKTVRTFSRFELEEVAKEAGFEHYKFFYPYPDYKFPHVIHTDELVEDMPVPFTAPNYDRSKVKLFEDHIFNYTLAQEGISKYFANSFFLELRNSDIPRESDNLVYSKQSASRDKKFRTCTSIYKKDNGYVVSKSPLTKEAKQHLEKMNSFSNHYFGKIKCLDSVMEDNNLSYEFIQSPNYSEQITDMIKSHSDKDKVITKLKEIYFAMTANASKREDFYTDEFKQVFGDKEIKEAFYGEDVSNIDLILFNLFNVNDEIVAIDYEWYFNFPVPIEYIFWRSLNYEIVHNKLFKNFFNMEELFNAMEFDTDWIDTFRSWENNFSKYVGSVPKPKQKIINGSSMVKKANESGKQLREKQKEINKLKKENKKLKKKVKLMESSKSWKITKPLRSLKKSI